MHKIRPVSCSVGTPEVLDLCDRLGLRYVFGLSKNARLWEHVQALEASTADRYARKGASLRRFKSFSYAARSWSKARRVIARVEVGPMGRDTRDIVTNLEGGRGPSTFTKSSIPLVGGPRTTSRAGRAISPRTARRAQRQAPIRCAFAGLTRPHRGHGPGSLLHGCAYWLWWTLRAACPKRFPWRRARFDTAHASIWSNWPRPSSRRKPGSS